MSTFLNQFFELLTEYGPVDEVWFNGAHPKTKGGQTYNYEAWKSLIHTLALGAVIFGREDNRWDYPEIAWGNYCKTLEALPCYGHISIQVR